MKKKIFIITGESSGDKLASSIVRHFRRNKFCISAIGSQHLKNNNLKNDVSKVLNRANAICQQTRLIQIKVQVDMKVELVLQPETL